VASPPGADAQRSARRVKKSELRFLEAIMIIKNCIAGARITVWDVLHYLKAGWSYTEIAETLRLSEAQVKAVARYIEDYREGLMVVQWQIEDHKARGNPPEIQDKLAKSKMKLQAWLK
jgi:uncharacterized protein (DUF433 family)